MGVGYDRLDRKALQEKRVLVCNVPDYGTEEIAEYAFHALSSPSTSTHCFVYASHAIALMLSLRRGIVLHHEKQQKAAAWAPIDTPLIARLRGQTFGIVGLGRIGTATGLRAKAFGFDVAFYDPYAPNGSDKALGIRRVRKLEELFRQSNVVSIHCPCTSQTRNLVTNKLLDLLPNGSVLINTARGEIVDIDAVYGQSSFPNQEAASCADLYTVTDALKEGKLAGAGLDVLPVEPVPSDKVPRLVQAYRHKEDWLEGRLVISPHSAYHSPSSFEDIRTNSAQTMRDVLLDGLMTNVIPATSE